MNVLLEIGGPELCIKRVETAYVVKYSVSTNSNVLKRNIVFSEKLFFKYYFFNLVSYYIIYYICFILF